MRISPSILCSIGFSRSLSGGIGFVQFSNIKPPASSSSCGHIEYDMFGAIEGNIFIASFKVFMYNIANGGRLELKEAIGIGDDFLIPCFILEELSSRSVACSILAMLSDAVKEVEGFILEEADTWIRGLKLGVIFGPSI